MLDYLLTTWNTNITDTAASKPISIKEIIAQQCVKIVNDLHIDCWPEAEVREFLVVVPFAAAYYS